MMDSIDLRTVRPQRWIRERVKSEIIGKPQNIFVSGGLVYKETPNVGDVDFLKERIKIAGESPYSTSVEAWLHLGGVFCGWAEKYIKGNEIKYFTNEIEVFKYHCKHQRFLISKGFYDMDCAQINWVKVGEGYLTFDKDAVFPLDGFTMALAKGARNHKEDFEMGEYWKLMNNAYRDINTETKELIRTAMTQESREEMMKAWADAERTVGKVTNWERNKQAAGVSNRPYSGKKNRTQFFPTAKQPSRSRSIDKVAQTLDIALEHGLAAEVMWSALTIAAEANEHGQTMEQALEAALGEWDI